MSGAGGDTTGPIGTAGPDGAARPNGAARPGPSPRGGTRPGHGPARGPGRGPGRRVVRNVFFPCAVAAALPVVEAWTGTGVAPLLRPVFVFAILGLGLNVVTGYTGLLNLGAAAFMALGAYCFSILTCPIYPFRLDFWSAVAVTTCAGALPGLLIGLPTLRLRGDYVAIVTLGFGEIVQDTLKNLESITKGTQGLNPLVGPVLFGWAADANDRTTWYYVLLAFLTAVVGVTCLVERSSFGRKLEAVREDELAAWCSGVDPMRVKLVAFSVGSTYCALAGALWASYLGSSGEPGTYDFQVSVLALCIVIAGGLGSIYGTLVGALLMTGLNSIVLVSLSDYLARGGSASGAPVYAVPGNWKFAVFGLVLVLMTRFRPHGLVPAAGGAADGGGRA